MLSAESSLPLQIETTDKKKGRSMFAKHFNKKKGAQVASKKDADNKGQQTYQEDDSSQPKRKTLGQRIAERND